MKNVYIHVNPWGMYFFSTKYFELVIYVLKKQNSVISLNYTKLYPKWIPELNKDYGYKDS